MNAVTDSKEILMLHHKNDEWRKNDEFFLTIRNKTKFAAG
jgi:hypothetical protein